MERRVAAFFEALDEDLNISGAMGQLFDLIREANSALDQGELTAGSAASLHAAWQRINSVLALQRDEQIAPADVLEMVEQRQKVRAEKNWAESDRLRDAIATRGWLVKDTKEGPKLSPK
jgi:cysteinyl-tRNA synthetase